MPKKSLTTTNSQIRSALRMLFLRSRERQIAIRRDGYTCQCCGKKQSKAKGREVACEVHHRSGVTNWQSMFDSIREHLLCNPDDLQTLCRECHDKDKIEHIERNIK